MHYTFNLIRCVSLLALLCVGVNAASAASLKSPDGKIEMHIGLKGRSGQSVANYMVDYEGEWLLDHSTVSFQLAGGEVVGEHLEEESIEGPKEHRGSWKPVYGERSEYEDNYNELTLNYRDTKLDLPLTLVFRCYNEGIAFHAVVGTPGKALQLKEERTEFRFFGNPTVWSTPRAQAAYEEVKLSQMGNDVERPLVARTTTKDGTELYTAIAEAKMVDFARMKLKRHGDDPRCVVSQLSGRVNSDGPITTPWRVVFVGRSPGELIENNHLILNLNDPCAIEDTSWIKPGKVIRDITLTTEGGKAAIDFAAKYNLQYIEFDAGWYGHEYDDASDATTITVDPKRSKAPFDLHYLIDYAHGKGLGVIVYVNRRALEKQLDEILPLYREWGIDGIKYGFVNVGSQKWTSWLHEAVRKAAKYEFMLDVHDEYRTTGYERTYPNWMVQEGVWGDEAAPSSEQALTSLFCRQIAGPCDFKICYFDERVDQKWSHAHQLAKAMCFYDPWQFLFWYDSPLDRGKQTNRIVETPELEFWRHMPTVWADKKVIHGEIGKFATIARRSDNANGDSEWFVGSMNAGEQRTLKVPLDFLEPGKKYTAHIYSDDPSVDTITQVRIDRKPVDSSMTLDVELRPNGGQAMRIVPAN